MNATRYWKLTQSNLSTYSYFLLFCLYVGVTFWHFLKDYGAALILELPQKCPYGILLWIIAGPIICLAVPRLAGWFIKRNLERQHPEMRGLAEWIETFGSPKNFPATREQKFAISQSAINDLDALGRGANAIFKLRDEMRDRARALPETSPERIALDSLAPYLGTLADDANAAYLNRWNLLRRILINFTARVGEESPRAYREALQ